MSKCRFKVGDVVRWTSQAGGNKRTKRGVVAMVLEDGKRVPTYSSVLAGKRRRFDNFESSPHRRVLVVVEVGGRAKDRVYRPYEKSLIKERVTR